eukprot:CAMPEP_0204356294 /NCGR_PEP_ID=MMETSP0469-20131031/34834_1 /ASSEMBLY_ACC=CAM_ASM_000384 /TAXON_ID=2969 /ORGANISM="Oxyrrhis marina" /LENGTH=50 /DNA_ID=CAMNT_0051343731 /DNA_START=1 /DNA_END=153 /DNA_ORIENTATION=+
MYWAAWPWASQYANKSPEQGRRAKPTELSNSTAAGLAARAQQPGPILEVH